MNKASNFSPLSRYEALLLGPLGEIYSARKKTKTSEWLSYSNLLIDKFAIHSSSYFHLSKGIIEHRKSGEKVKANGYDLFTVNTTHRAIIETYITFNHIFVEPKSEQEKEFRFLLWKLDGLYQKMNYNIDENDVENLTDVLNQKNLEIKNLIERIKTSDFKNKINSNLLSKIFNPDKKRINWRFLYDNGTVNTLSISGLVKHVLKTRGFTNAYKYGSIHTHSNFPAIEEFKKMRGKPIYENYTDPLTELAILLTCFIMYDIAEIDDNAKKELNNFPLSLKNYIIGMTESSRKTG